MEIKEVSSEFLRSVITDRLPVGLFFTHTAKDPIEVLEDSGYKTFKEDEDLFIGVDNSTGHAWTEEFDSFDKCKRWLEGESLEGL